MAQPHWRKFWQFLTKLNKLLTYDPVVALLNIYPKELKMYFYTEPYTRMFVATLFTIENLWKQQRCSSVGERINCVPSRQCTRTQGYEETSYQATRRHRWTLHAFLGKEGQLEKTNYCMVPTIWNFGKGKRMETVTRSVVVREEEERGVRIGSTQRTLRAMKLLCGTLLWCLL